jgi:hypothetical protein
VRWTFVCIDFLVFPTLWGCEFGVAAISPYMALAICYNITQQRSGFRGAGKFPFILPLNLVIYIYIWPDAFLPGWGIVDVT